MRLFPAIDIRFGKVVRLQLGDYDRMTVYDDDPVSAAKAFMDAGAKHLHIVDLDAAKDGTSENTALIGKMTSLGIDTQVGGGARSIEAIKRYLENGAERVIIGSAAVTEPDMLFEALELFGERIAVGVDSKNGKVAIHGWREITDKDSRDFLFSLKDAGIKTCIYTDISRDGVLAGIDHEAYGKLQSESGINIIASGGVSSLDDIRALRDAGLWGAITGKALYAGRFSLSEALKEAGE